MKLFSPFTLPHRMMDVREHLRVPSSLGESDYFICPRCGVLLEREFVPFCDQCGQRLGWKKARQEVI